MISLRKVGVFIAQKKLIRDVSLEIVPGEVHVLLGHNGAGKSTLMKTLTGERAASEGEIWFSHRPLHRWAAADLAQRRAVVQQFVELPFSMSVMDLVLLGRLAHGGQGESSEDVQIAVDSLVYSGAEHLGGRMYQTLSGGERQKVMLAKALAQIWDAPHPRALLLDEPFSNMDLSIQQEMMAILSRLSKEGTAVFLIVHDLNLASRFADRITIMRDGRILSTGTPKEVMTCALVQQAFGLPVEIWNHPKKDYPVVIPM